MHKMLMTIVPRQWSWTGYISLHIVLYCSRKYCNTLIYCNLVSSLLYLCIHTVRTQAVTHNAKQNIFHHFTIATRPFKIVCVLIISTNISIYNCTGSVRNNSWPSAILQPISAFCWPKSILVGQISCTFSMGQQSVTYKISYLQKTANQFLILISSTSIGFCQIWLVQYMNHMHGK